MPQNNQDFIGKSLINIWHKWKQTEIEILHADNRETHISWIMALRIVLSAIPMIRNSQLKCLKNNNSNYKTYRIIRHMEIHMLHYFQS